MLGVLGQEGEDPLQARQVPVPRQLGCSADPRRVRCDLAANGKPACVAVYRTQADCGPAAHQHARANGGDDASAERDAQARRYSDASPDAYRRADPSSHGGFHADRDRHDDSLSRRYGDVRAN